jgi:hypothetical protein
VGNNLEGKIIQLFDDWCKKYEKGNGEVKDQIHQRMYGFIIALELSGKNLEAKKCKAIYAKLTGQ